MYPSNALGEFYPWWLVLRAEQRGAKTNEEVHAYCSPIMRRWGYADHGEAALDAEEA